MFIPDGDPNNFIIVNKMNWTGIGLRLSRNAWEDHKKRNEFDKAGVYILIGYTENEDLPSVYIGQGDGVRSRIESHIKNKEFWDKVIVFTTSSDGLNRAHITWLEYALIRKAKETGRCILDNNAEPNEPVLTESEKADTEEFFNELLSVLPLIEVKVFEKGEKIRVDNGKSKGNDLQNTIVVPAQEDGFNKVFIHDKCWYAIRISGGKLNSIKYIAAYQTSPISAITHYAEVESIEPYGDGSKYKLNFKSDAMKIGPIVYGKAKKGSMQGPRYTSIDKLLRAKELNDLF